MKYTILTVDKVLDRRTVQQADSLRARGFDVSIISTCDGVSSADDGKTKKSTATTSIYESLPDSFKHCISSIYNACFVDFAAYYEHKLLERATREKAEVYQASDLPTLSSAVKAAGTVGAKVVYDSHELFCESDYLTDAERRKWAKLERRYIKKADAVMTVNASIARELSRRYGIPEPAVVMNKQTLSAPSEQGSPFTVENGFPKGCRVLLFQGTMVKKNNIVPLVEMLSSLDESTVLCLVGDADEEYRKQLCERADTLGVSSRLVFVPRVSQTELRRYTEHAFLGLIPYTASCLNHYYCTPNKLYEYISSELPCASSDLPELRSIVVGEGIGITCDFTDSADIASKINRLLDTPEEMQRFRDNLRDVRGKYSWEYEQNVYLSTIQSIM